MKRFLYYFVQGLLLFIPVIITFAILFKVFDFFSGIFSFFGFSSNTLLNTVLGLILSLSVIALMGVLASSLVFKHFFNWMEEKLEHAPLIRHIYSPIKDFTGAFVGNKKRFNKPVLVTVDKLNSIQQLGFITQTDLSDLGIKERVAVYLPLSYSLSGKLIIVPTEQIQKVDKDAPEVMKFIISGGVTDVD
ncbi:MAG: DUF502 domain-containing protein [Sediminibacterium sp.]|nr:DUF502 domain-containing protein [Sediminibacterium sp.]